MPCSKFVLIIVLKRHLGFDILEFQNLKKFKEFERKEIQTFWRLFKLLDRYPAVKVIFHNVFRTMQFCNELSCSGHFSASILFTRTGIISPNHVSYSRVGSIQEP